MVKPFSLGITPRLARRLNWLLEKAQMTEHTFMLLLAILIGVLAGFGAIGIRLAIYEVQKWSFPGGGNALESIQASAWYLVLLLPALGGLVVGPLVHFLAPEARGTGVPEVIQAVLVKGGMIRPRVALIKALASSITIGTGGSVGREGPIIQIGASLGSTVGQFFRLSGTRIKTLVGCGAASGIAAAFNAPIAGAMFAVEIILQDFAVAQFSPIVISSVVATVIAHQFEGNFAAFILPTYQLVSYWEIIGYGVLGLACGVISSIFIRGIHQLEQAIERGMRLPRYLWPVVGGLLVGFLGLRFPQIMGVGYESINLALHGQMLWYLALVLVFVKIFATGLTLGFGGSGGIFAPSLFTGAMLGCFLGSMAQSLFPGHTASAGAYALVAMGGIVAGTTRAPITAIIIIFELTNQYEVILPLMVTCIISTLISSKFHRESIYTLKLLSRNIKIQEGKGLNVMKTLFIKDLAIPEVTCIAETAHFKEVVDLVINHRSPYFPVLDKKNHLVGMISIHTIKQYLFQGEELHDLIIARDVAMAKIQTLHPEDDCQMALDKMEKTGLLALPVVSSKEEGLLLGMVWQKDILDAYQREIQQREIATTLLDKIHSSMSLQGVQYEAGYDIREVPTPAFFLGRSIREINIRAKFGVVVLAVRSKTEHGFKTTTFPGPEFIFRGRDQFLVVAGEAKNTSLLKQLS